MVDFISTNRYRERDSGIPAGSRILGGSLYRYVVATNVEKGLYYEYYTQTSATPQMREATWDFLHPGPPFASGSNFTSIKSIMPKLHVQDQGTFRFHNGYCPAAWNMRYEGGFFDPLWLPGWDTMTDQDYSIQSIVDNAMLVPDLSTLGAGAYNRLRPSPERAGLAMMLAEARDLPRMMKSTSKVFSDIWGELGGQKFNIRMAPKKAADNFLNGQFGWIPFLSDMQKLSSAVDNSHIYMSQIKRDNNRWVRRRRADKQLVSETIIYQRTDITGCQPAGSGYTDGMIVGPKTYTVTLQEYTDVWYEGVFKYYRPEFDPRVMESSDPAIALWGGINRQMTLYGAHINPTVIWRATPWTWLADWFGNIDQIIQYGQDLATDSMVSKYMYLMHHHRRRFELKSEFSTCDGAAHRIVWYREADIKRREKAGSPFEFVLSGGNLTPRQIAILMALGISRVP